MDEIRKVAKAYYDGAAVSEKILARKLFRSLDSDGNGKVSLREYKKMVNPSFSSNDLFRQLDANCDGTLDFDEVLALNYMDKVSVPRCNACNSLLLHSYFSCLPCQADVSYNLCCNCYTAGGDRFSHHHSSNNFVDTRAMLKLLDNLLKQAEIIINDDHKTHHLQGSALEEEAEDDSTEDDDYEEEEEEEEEGDDDEGEVEGEDDDEEEGEVEEDDDEREYEEGDNDEDGDDEEVADGVDTCEVLNRNLMNYGKALYESQPELEKSNGYTKAVYESQPELEKSNGYTKAVYKSQPESEKPNGFTKKSRIHDIAEKELKLRSGSEREKVMEIIDAVNDKVVCFKEKKKKVSSGTIEVVNKVCLKGKKKKVVLRSIEAVNDKVVCLKEKKNKIVLGSIEAVNNKVISFKEKKKNVKTVISVGTAVINIGGKAAASSLFHHVVRRRICD